MCTFPSPPGEEFHAGLFILDHIPSSHISSPPIRFCSPHSPSFLVSALMIDDFISINHWWFNLFLGKLALSWFSILHPAGFDWPWGAFKAGDSDRAGDRKRPCTARFAGHSELCGGVGMRSLGHSELWSCGQIWSGPQARKKSPPDFHFRKEPAPTAATFGKPAPPAPGLFPLASVTIPMNFPLPFPAPCRKFHPLDLNPAPMAFCEHNLEELIS